VDRDAALQNLVLLVHETREGLLRERDERQLVRHLEHGKADGARLLDERARELVVIEARAEPEPCQVAPRQQPHELALACVALELDPRRQKQLAARQPGGRVGQLRDVHPANRGVGSVTAHRKLEAHLRDESSNGEHHSPVGAPTLLSGERSAPTPR
jgi:hypothetical protein